MGIELDATEDKAAAPIADAEQSSWDDMEDTNEDNGIQVGEVQTTLAEPPAVPAENSTVTASDSETPEPQPLPGPTPADRVTKAREKVRKLREREERLKCSLNEARRGIDRAVMEVGQAVVDHPDFLLAAATEAPEVKVSANWQNAPIEMLKLPGSTMQILKKRHGMVTVGEVAAYMEANGAMSGLDGITERRAERIEKDFAEFVKSWK